MKRYRKFFENNTNLNKFIDIIKSNSSFYQNGMGFYLKNYPVLVDVSIFNSRVHISSIVSLDKEKGHASEVMKWLCNLADELSVEIELLPKKIGKDGLSTTQLKTWYKKFNFLSSKNQNIFIRFPINGNEDNLSNKEKVVYDSIQRENGLLRSLMDKDEIVIAENLIKKNLVAKGHWGKDKSVIYYPNIYRGY